MTSERMPWLRLYTEIIDDEKIRLLAFEDRWHYVALLCCKRAGLLDAGDNPTLLMRKLSVKLGLALRELEAMLCRLGEVGLVDPATAQPLGWEGRQFASDTDPTAADRKRRQRQRQRENAPPHPVTGESRVTVTDVTRTDTDADTDADTEKQSASHSRAAAKAATPLSQDDMDFGEAWAAYPKRAGGNSRADARKAWNARRRSGVSAADILAGVQRYAEYIRATGKEHTEYVKQGATFFGPGEHYALPWTPPRDPAKPEHKSAMRAAVENLFIGGSHAVVSGGGESRRDEALLPEPGSLAALGYAGGHGHGLG